MAPAPTEGQLPLFNDPPPPTPATVSDEPLSKVPRRPAPKLTCADCGDELKPAVSGKLWHTETETKLPSRGKRYLVPCPVTGSKEHGYADNRRSG